MNYVDSVKPLRYELLILQQFTDCVSQISIQVDNAKGVMSMYNLRDYSHVTKEILVGWTFC